MKENKIEWQTQQRKISDLLVWKDNPRKISNSNLKELKNSLKKFNYAAPIIINTDGRIIAGHMRLKALTALGEADRKIEVRIPNRQLTDEECQELSIRDNKNIGEWDWLKLEQLFTKGDLFEWGFKENEFKPFKNFSDETKEEDSIPANTDEVSQITMSGDLWELNNHRLLCGDSTLKKDADQLFNGQKFKMLFTSPPYNMKSNLYTGYKDNRHNEDFIAFNLNVLMNFKRYLTDDGFVFWNMSYNKNSAGSFIEIFHHFLKHSGLIFLEDIVWDKGHGMPLTDQLTRQYEHLLVLNQSIENIHYIDHVGVFGKQSIPFIKDTQTGVTNYWRIDTFKSQTQDIKAAFPVELPAKAISIATREGDVITDCFGGSGTTIIAAEKTGRRCYSMELDPRYCDLIVQRFYTFCKQNERSCVIKKNGVEFIIN